MGYLDQRSDLLLFTAITELVPHAPFSSGELYSEERQTANEKGGFV